jgi:single-stranded DNA-binding protein
MTILALVTGSLFRNPERREGKSDHFAIATIKWLEDGRPHYAKVFAFEQDARAALLDLAKGDTLSVAGRLAAELYEKDGEHRIGLKIVADKIMPLKPRPRSATTAGKEKTHDNHRR